ncbi:hypothetical protein FHX49_002348 [Microbacterium endophyticum]|uniref:Dinucleotide-utilizing enzyme n=1 Tax=Microbacterium endophyticum TaxID=1526412 RepID=A0A7W4YP26_9MICO|nr:dinucleotide-utilizing enzyme [Microbacterium endophyticum]MBB2976762.1 hypothetical protein [Microbacterium endophyticum]NIK36601.1 hypothetical protein [Microbacterium endophyticum]
MNNRPRLYRSIPYWVLVIASIAAVAYGAWLTVDKLSIMTATLADGTATGVEVYAGQAWVAFAAAFVAAGLIGLVAALALAVARSVFSTTAPAAVEVVEIVEEPVSEPVVTDDVADDTTAPVVESDAATTQR